MKWSIFHLPQIFVKLSQALHPKTAKKNHEKRQRAKRRKVGFWYGDKGWNGHVVESRDSIY
jgi:hypothetical protein